MIEVVQASVLSLSDLPAVTVLSSFLFLVLVGERLIQQKTLIVRPSTAPTYNLSTWVDEAGGLL